MTIPRMEPLSPPYAPEVQAALEKWMPPGSGVEPLRLFRTLAKNARLADRMRGLGGALLGGSGLPLRVRELLILRTTARCGAEYEWGVHVSAFAASVGLEEHVVAATAQQKRTGGALPGEDEVLLALVDELHDTASVSDETWSALAGRFDETQILEMLAVVGFYHLISYVVNGVRIEREPWARSFP